MTAERTKAIKELEYVKKQTGYADIALDLAIKALEQQPCEDCVARSEALDILDDFEEDIENGKFKTAYAKARERMCELSSVTPQQPQWIPVSERLPEEHKEVLTCGLGGYIEIQSFEDSYGGYWENQKGDWSDLDEITAWMPLPEPYKESEE